MFRGAGEDVKPSTARRILTCCLVLAVLAATGLASSALGGCATPLAGNWSAERTHRPLPAEFHAVAAAELSLVCGEAAAGARRLGCAHRDYARSVCHVYTLPNPSVALIQHEAMHCAGWSHD